MKDYLSENDIDQLCSRFSNCKLCGLEMNGSIKFWCYYAGGRPLFQEYATNRKDGLSYIDWERI